MANVEVLKLEPGNTYLFSDAENGLIQANVAKAIREQVEAGLQHIAEINRPKLIVLSQGAPAADEPKATHPPIFGSWVGDQRGGVHVYADERLGQIVIGRYEDRQKFSPFAVVVGWDGEVVLQFADPTDPRTAMFMPVPKEAFEVRLRAFINSFADLLQKPQAEPAPADLSQEPESTAASETSPEPEAVEQSESIPADATAPE